MPKNTKYNATGRDRIQKWNQEHYYKSLSGKYSVAKSSARINKKMFTLTLEEYSKLVTQPCVYCGISLLDECGVSLYRIINSAGYQLGNVLPCCKNCNWIKGISLTVEEMRIAMKAVLLYRKEQTDVNGKFRRRFESGALHQRHTAD